MAYETTVESTAFGVAQDNSGNGMTARQLRMILQDHWQTTGIITGGDNGRNAIGTSGGMYYQLPWGGTAVVSRGADDGFAEVWWPPNSRTANVPANTAGQPRIDAVWVRAGDVEQGDSSNRVIVGVTCGTAAANPQAPAVANGTVIQYLQVPANANTTAGATIVGNLTYALVHGASMGQLWHDYTSVFPTGDAQSQRKIVFWHPYQFAVERTIELRAYISMATKSRKDGEDGVCGVDFLVDTQSQAHATRKIVYDKNWTTFEFSTVVPNLQPGWHNFGLMLCRQRGVEYNVISGYRQQSDTDKWQSQYSGITFSAIDLGVTR